MLVPSALLLLYRRRDSLIGLGLGPACAERVGGGGGVCVGGGGSSVPRGILYATCSNGVHSAASYPRPGAVIPNSVRTGCMPRCV